MKIMFFIFENGYYEACQQIFEVSWNHVKLWKIVKNCEKELDQTWD
jgi:hypothetical protein